MGTLTVKKINHKEIYIDQVDVYLLINIPVKAY